MSRYLLDTNVLIHVVNRAKGFEFIEQRIASTNPEHIKISALTVWEISRMVEKANVPNPKIKARAVKAALETLRWFKVEPLTSIAAAVGGNLHAMLANKGKTISERDSMIAGIAMVNDYVMVTDNVTEYGRAPGLLVQNWRQP